MTTRSFDTFLVAVLVVIGGLAGGCGKDRPPGSDPETGANGSGALDVALTLAKGVTLDTVSYTLTDATGGTVQSGSISVRNSESIEF